MPFGAYLRLAFKNAVRNRRRTLLTVASVAVSLFLLVSLRTLVTEMKGDTLMTKQSAQRLIVRNAVSLQVPLPLSYRERLAKIDGVDMVSRYQWIPSTYKNPNEPVIVIAADPEFMDTDPEYYTPPAETEAFRRDRTGALMPVKLMRRYNLKLGDRITYTGTVFPFNMEMTIRGTFVGPNQNAPLCHFEYVNELWRQHIPSRADRTMGYILHTRSAEETPRVAAAIDAMFHNSEVPTRTENEKNFVLGFTTMLGNVELFLAAISAAVLFAIVLVTTMTMSMAVRERLHELAVLKAIGFRPGQLTALVVGESVLIAAAGGLLGVGGARLFFTVFDIFDMTDGMLQHFVIVPKTLALGALTAVLMGVVSSAIPAVWGTRKPIAAVLRNIA